MPDIVKSFVFDFKFNSYIALILYWLPLMMCSIGYAMRTASDYKRDLKERHTKFYSPSLTIGVLVARAIITVTPVANLWTAVIKFASGFFHDIIEAIIKLFNVPLVPKKYREDSQDPANSNGHAKH